MSDLLAHAAQGRFMAGQMDRMIGDLEDAHSACEPAPGLKTAGWLLGHLAVTGDFGRKLCGRTPQCPREWRAAFNPGSQPSHRAEDYPRMAVLRGTLRDVYTDLCAAAETADAATLAQPNSFVPMQQNFPTAGEFVGYLLTGHLAYHMGQLVAWRGAAGLTPRGRSERA